MFVATALPASTGGAGSFSFSAFSKQPTGHVSVLAHYHDAYSEARPSAFTQGIASANKEIPKQATCVCFCSLPCANLPVFDSAAILLSFLALFLSLSLQES